MKRLYSILAVLLTLTGLLSACENSEQVYEGPSYVLFADTLNICPVGQSEQIVDIALSATRVADRNRTFGIEVIQPASNAVEGYHYTIASNTITIPAGELAASVGIKGIYDHIGETDSLGIRLRIVALDNVEWPIFGLETNVRLQKVCPYETDDFTRYAIVKSSFLDAFRALEKQRLIYTERVEGTQNSIVLHDFLTDGFDVQLTFDNSDPLDPKATLRSGDIIATTQDILGGTYNDNMLRVTDYLPVPSTFNSCRNTVRLYSIVYVKDVGTLGAYETTIRWVSDAEAEDMLKNGL